MSRHALRPRARAVLDMIARYKRENHGNSPGIRQIKDSVGEASTSTTWRLVRECVGAGELIESGGGFGIPGYRYVDLVRRSVDVVEIGSD